MTKVYRPSRCSRALGRRRRSCERDRKPRRKKPSVDVKIVRNGSRGLFWLEPLVEVETPRAAIAYGPVGAEDVAGPVRCRLPARADARSGLGPTEDIPYSQEPGAPDFRARAASSIRCRIDDYRAHGGYDGLAQCAEDAAARHRHGGHDFGPARPRRRRLPDRHQVEHRLDAPGRPEIRRLQCRRGRQRHLRRPHADGRRSLHADRRHDHRRHRGRRHQGLHLHPLANIRTPSQR